MFFDIEGKNAFITGGVSGIGLAVAERFITAGAKVVLADLNDDQGVADKIGAHFIRCNVASEQEVAGALDFAETQLGKLDIVINNAGIGNQGPTIEATDLTLLNKVFEVNVNGVFHGLKHAPRHMNDGGVIINTASMAALLGIGGNACYHASKAAVVNLTQTAAMELGSRAIRVTAVCPTVAKTQILGEDDSTLNFAATLSPLNKTPSVDDIAGVFHFLASDEATFLTGSAITVDGGGNKGFSFQALEKLMV